jgi:hypothetical protein
MADQGCPFPTRFRIRRLGYEGYAHVKSEANPLEMGASHLPGLFGGRIQVTRLNECIPFGVLPAIGTRFSPDLGRAAQ